MLNNIPISQARAQLPEIVKNASDLSQKTFISVQGKVKAVVMSAKELALMESTLEVLNDPDTMKAIKVGEKEAKYGELVDWEELKQELDL